MMHPELMEIIAKSHHEYLRSLARGDSFTNDVRHLTRSVLDTIGSGMVRTGRWLEGHTRPANHPDPTVTFQEP